MICIGTLSTALLAAIDSDSLALKVRLLKLLRKVDSVRRLAQIPSVLD